MNEVKYPEIPRIIRKPKLTGVEYNGIKLYIRHVRYKEHRSILRAHVRFATLHYDIFTRKCHTVGILLTDKQKKGLKKINYKRSPHREYLLDVIQEYAPWFTKTTKGVLENIIINALDPTHSTPPANNGRVYDKERERRHFCNVLKLSLRLNIPPEEAEELLRTGKYKDQL